MFHRYMARRAQKREREIRAEQLRKDIYAVYERELDQAKTSEDREEARRVAHSQMMYEEDELEHLRQAELIDKLSETGLTIPKEHFVEIPEWGVFPVLTYAGEMWVRRELTRLRREKIEFWSKLILPIVSLIISIIALVRKH